MIRTRHYQPSLWTGVLAEEVEDLWEPWMVQADQLLDDEQLIERVFEAQGKRWKKSKTRGRKQTPSEVVLRLLVLKHVRDWSFEVRELRSDREPGEGARCPGSYKHLTRPPGTVHAV